MKGCSSKINLAIIQRVSFVNQLLIVDCDQLAVCVPIAPHLQGHFFFQKSRS